LFVVPGCKDKGKCKNEKIIKCKNEKKQKYCVLLIMNCKLFITFASSKKRKIVKLKEDYGSNYF